MDDYTRKQTQRDAQYAQAWKTLTPEQLSEMARHGIKGAELPRYHTGKTDDADTMVAIAETHQEPSCGLEVGEGGTDTPEASNTDPEANYALGEALRLAIHDIVESSNPSLHAQCVSLAFGFGAARGQTLAQVAEEFGQTRASISKRVKQIQARFKLPPSAYMKSPKSCLSYAKYNGRS